jgi:hypothetical protein
MLTITSFLSSYAALFGLLGAAASIAGVVAFFASVLLRRRRLTTVVRLRWPLAA